MSIGFSCYTDIIMLKVFLKIKYKIMIPYWFLSSLPTALQQIVITYIKERGKLKRIEKLKDLNESTIDAIGNYEKKVNSSDKQKTNVL